MSEQVKDLKDLTAADIFGADDIKIEPVDVPEWKGRVYVRSMDAAARDKFDVASTDDEGKPNLVNFRPRLLALTMCDAAGNLLFTEADIEKLAKKSSAAVLRIYAVAKKLNKVGADEVAGEKKDSAEAPSAGSPIGSP